MMRRATLALLLLCATGMSASASLRLDTFFAEIELREDGTVRVQEEIGVTFYTPHHGIEREIPVSYRVPATGANLTIGFALEAVAMDGDPVPFLSRRRGRDEYLRIGDADRLITGSHAYTISYVVDRVLLFDDEYVRLYWNVTGNEWRIPITNAVARVRLPESVDPAVVATTSYTGYTDRSARGGSGSLDAEGRLLFEGGPFTPGEGLTIDLAVPRELLGIDPPTFGQRALWFLDANKLAVLPILTFFGMLALWFRVGRDPRRRVIAPAFAPPRGMHAGEVGVLIDDRIDLRDVSAIIVGLAVKGHLRIEEVGDEDQALLEKARSAVGRSAPSDYRFVRREAPTDDLSDVEKLVLEGIFDEDRVERTLSSLENDFYKHLPAVRSRLYAGLIDAGYYASNPERTRGFYRNLGAFVIVAGIAVGVSQASLYLGLAVALSGLVVLAFSPIMPRKTKKGVRALEEILGLSRYIRLAEVDRIEFHNAPEKSPQVFERMLPYAIALNLTRVWTQQFEGLLKEPPEWYASTGPVFRPHLFTLSLWHLSAGMNRTLASAPRAASSGRSAWRGGGSFGGGFSGGGFGGGGGGGW